MMFPKEWLIPIIYLVILFSIATSVMLAVLKTSEQCRADYNHACEMAALDANQPVSFHWNDASCQATADRLVAEGWNERDFVIEDCWKTCDYYIKTPASCPKMAGDD
jgi:hypothetical protein